MTLRLKLILSFGLILAVWLFTGYYTADHLNRLDELQSTIPEIDLKKNQLIRSYDETSRSLRTSLILHTNVKTARESSGNHFRIQFITYLPLMLLVHQVV